MTINTHPDQTSSGNWKRDRLIPWPGHLPAELIERELGELRRSLTEAGLEIGALDCHRGSPPTPPAPPLETHWIHVTA